MKKSLLFGAVTAMLLVACSGGSKFNVELSVPEAAKGHEAYILNAENGDTLAMTEVTDTIITFTGEVETPSLAVIVLGGYPMAQFALEPGNITFTADGMAQGTPMNDSYATFTESITDAVTRLQADQSEEGQQRIMDDELVPASVKFIKENPENVYSLAVFGQVAMYMQPAQVKDVVAAAPKLAENEQVQQVVKYADAKEATSAGKKYVDFTLQQPDSTNVSLSSLIEPGHYTVVDFWASWCKPCRGELPGLKALYEKYHGQGLNVVGVAVWDQPEKTKQAVEEEKLPWPIIYNGTRETTELYGIMGIPCIMLIGPDGTIVARDLFGSELAAAVDKAMAQAN
jgi:thiol-disulfide isomerase/thioredoxin